MAAVRSVVAAQGRALLRRSPLAATASRRLRQSAAVAVRRNSTAVAASPADEEELRWEADFVAATDTIYDSSRSFEDSAAGLRALIKTGLLRHTDLRDRPERFFKAHRLLARHAVQQGPGFWIRFTVHYNLCFGTVLAVGSDEQIAALDDVEATGQLGCFALTEKLAGVQSGLIVQTKAVFDEGTDCFVLSNVGETDGAYKNWISQGFVADKAVVLADLSIGGERKGPHAFLMDMRTGGRLTAGVSTGDMGTKTAVKPFEMIGQRLYTGRIAVAQAAPQPPSHTRRKPFEDTKAYPDAKPILYGTGAPLTLSSIPQLASLFEEAEATAGALEKYVASCEEELTPLLRNGGVPYRHGSEPTLDSSLWRTHSFLLSTGVIHSEVGSYALMGDSGFGSMDFLQCCKFAEGDSRVLMLKMARDRLRRYAKEAKSGAPLPAGEEEEAALCEALAAAVGTAKGDKALEAAAWDREWRGVHALAESIMRRTLEPHGR
ncbi:hypothetical protein EMIHUDRAFT_450487 [Emiliania huxleyi CCMP1516]|uniref:Uncharacterized protein n=2 Tax=Emiliania huxleyi TaxID=2903 RepID=A0A0D3JP08_EMIH1|nr:hypothetical protein EMIHUDRAFT_450487 [Emiliania huxleyi CCMP1516]EOD25243.1 hypothetical protein EMIHUDRAFT_450487 [Emiliania huxleyi CCMP1516]|eukprot:XP_005777672.1 hypothetical protein EMIHUDRAFT_450487 [Emiliania huxleyi CCMP1516]